MYHDFLGREIEDLEMDNMRNDWREQVEDSLRNGDFTSMARQFIKVGQLLFNRNNINVVNLDSSDGYINVYTSDNTEFEGSSNKGYQLEVSEPSTQAFIAWLTDEDRCEDMMAPEMHRASESRYSNDTK
jgi:hypothetical protein